MQCIVCYSYQDAPEEMISAAVPVAPPRERIKYTLDDFDLLATLGRTRVFFVDVYMQRTAGAHTPLMLYRSIALSLCVNE